MIRMQKLEAFMEAVEGAYFVQSDQVASGRAGWAKQCGCARRLACRRGMQPSRRPAFKYRISHFSSWIYWHFNGQGPYFLTISVDRSNNILKFSVGRIFIYLLPKANVGTVLNINYYKLIFQDFFQFYFEIKI
jgi:hypothetical protein